MFQIFQYFKNKESFFYNYFFSKIIFFWWCQCCVDYNLQIILIKVLKIILTITDKFEQNMSSLTWWWCWWWWWYIFSSTSNYLQDLNQSWICTMIIITKKWPHSYFSQVIKNSECIRKLLALAQKVSDLGGTRVLQTF